MSDLASFVGNKIKLYRKQKKMSVEELAKAIGKSKSTISKYETGKIIIDIETLEDIARAFGVSITQLIEKDNEDISSEETLRGFFSNNTFYIYFYDGRVKKIIKGLLKINKYIIKSVRKASIYMDVQNFSDFENCKTLYYGETEVNDIVTNMLFTNQANEIEKINIIAINPMSNEIAVSAMLSGISGNPFIPAAFKCLISLKPLKEDDVLRDNIIFGKDDLKTMKKLNFFTNQKLLM